MSAQYEEYLAEQLLLTDDPVGVCVRRMIESFPEADLALIVLAMAGLAADIELGQGASGYPPGLPDQIYRATALLSVDILILSRDGGRVPGGADLLRHWIGTGEAVFASG